MLSKLRSWGGAPTLRHLLLETFIIVIGVLIALAVNQWADQRRWRGEVRQFREAVDLEIANGLWAFQYRREQSLCFEKRLDEIAALAATWQRGEHAKLDRPMVRPTLRVARTTLWESRTPEVMSHLEFGDRVDYARAYSGIEIFMRQMLEERGAWQQLQLVNWIDHMSYEQAAELQRQVGIARSLDNVMRLNFKNFATNAARLRLSPVEPESHEPWDRAICLPLHWSPA